MGRKGELVNVSRHQAYYELLPTQLAVYPTEEYLEYFKKERETSGDKPKVSPYAHKTKEHLQNMILEIPMNLKSSWTLDKDHIRVALRYNVN